ncbi:histone-lysine N-methyltransferase SETMAR [Plakobranchus ocellatus]|uniref:Histone-lysine N-methyltransferase SETMAR n=1 Tax=Plakobranchus ocellatus TaxID=259542 RepID=A0AAV3ZPI1_9GAST|nr:histone-lysine N-methyltransferase SETMAR [Plakobranchus ocellatus]
MFWDAKGVILLDILPQGQCINAARYCSTLDRLKEAIRRKRPGLLRRGVVLQHDNATPHSANLTQQWLQPPKGIAIGLVWPAAPGIKFDSKPPSLQEDIAVVNKARAKSAPGPNGVPYLLYKICPNILKKLHKILRSAWKNIKISKEWMTAEEVYIPKEQDSKGIN